MRRRDLISSALAASVSPALADSAEIGGYSGPDAGVVVVSLANNGAASFYVQLERVDRPGETHLTPGSRPDFKGGFADPDYLKLFHEQGVKIDAVPYRGKVRSLRVPPGRYRLGKAEVEVSGIYNRLWTRFKTSIEFNVTAGQTLYVGRLLAIPSILTPAWRVVILDARDEDLRIAQDKARVATAAATFEALEAVLAQSQKGFVDFY